LLAQIRHPLHESETSVQRANSAPEDAVAHAAAVSKKLQQISLKTGARLRINYYTVSHQFEISKDAINDGAEKGFACWSHERCK
jgi:hypothetical protein